jgi:hypothetical protein
MFNLHTLDMGDACLFEKVEHRFRAFLAEHGLSHPGELPPEVRDEILRRAVIEAAVVNFPGAGLEGLSHGIKSFTHPAFLLAMERVQWSVSQDSDALELARGIDAAVVLAGFGLPVAPYDWLSMIIFGPTTNDIDTVLDQFSCCKNAAIGYSVCDAPFYVLLTECVRDLRKSVRLYPELSEVKKLFKRPGASLPPDPGKNFEPGMALFVRQPGDAISSVGLSPVEPIVLFAGWQVDGERHGAPHDGYLPVPLQLLRAVVTDPAAAALLSRPVGVATPIH